MIGVLFDVLLVLKVGGFDDLGLVVVCVVVWYVFDEVVCVD